MKNEPQRAALRLITNATPERGMYVHDRSMYTCSWPDGRTRVHFFCRGKESSDINNTSTSSESIIDETETITFTTMKFNQVIAALSLLGGNAFMAHVHAGDVNGVGDSKEDGYANNLHLPSTLHKNGSGKVHGHGDIVHANADAGEHSGGVQRQRRAKSKGKKKKNGNSGRSNDDGDDGEMVAIPLTFRLKNLSDDVDMDRLKSALRDLVEKTAKNWAECNTEGGEGSFVVELVDDENNQGMFERKLTLAGTWEMILMTISINCSFMLNRRHVYSAPLRDCAILLSDVYQDLIQELLLNAELWNELIW